MSGKLAFGTSYPERQGLWRGYSALSRRLQIFPKELTVITINLQIQMVPRLCVTREMKFPGRKEKSALRSTYLPVLWNVKRDACFSLSSDKANLDDLSTLWMLICTTIATKACSVFYHITTWFGEVYDEGLCDAAVNMRLQSNKTIDDWPHPLHPSPSFPSSFISTTLTSIQFAVDSRLFSPSSSHASTNHLCQPHRDNLGKIVLKSNLERQTL